MASGSRAWISVGQPKLLRSWMSWDQHLQLHSSKAASLCGLMWCKLSGFNLKCKVALVTCKGLLATFNTSDIWLHSSEAIKQKLFIEVRCVNHNQQLQLHSSEAIRQQVCGVARLYLQAARKASTGFTWQLTIFQQWVRFHRKVSSALAWLSTLTLNPKKQLIHLFGCLVDDPH